MSVLEKKRLGGAVSQYYAAWSRTVSFRTVEWRPGEVKGDI